MFKLIVALFAFVAATPIAGGDTPSTPPPSTPCTGFKCKHPSAV